MAAFIDHSISGTISVVENVFVFSTYYASKNGTRIPEIEVGSRSLGTTIKQAQIDVDAFDSTIWDMSGDKAKFVKDTK